VTGAQSLRIRGTMNGVPVTVEPATDAGRLHPRYKNSIGIFTLETESLRTCPSGVNIDGTLMLDFDEDRVLAGVELLLPMSGWKGKPALLDHWHYQETSSCPGASPAKWNMTGQLVSAKMCNGMRLGSASVTLTSIVRWRCQRQPVPFCRMIG